MNHTFNISRYTYTNKKQKTNKQNKTKKQRAKPMKGWFCAISPKSSHYFIHRSVIVYSFHYQNPIVPSPSNCTISISINNNTIQLTNYRFICNPLLVCMTCNDEGDTKYIRLMIPIHIIHSKNTNVRIPQK